jgi:hypothetical protein
VLDKLDAGIMSRSFSIEGSHSQGERMVMYFNTVFINISSFFLYILVSRKCHWMGCCSLGCLNVSVCLCITESGLAGLDLGLEDECPSPPFHNIRSTPHRIQKLLRVLINFDHFFRLFSEIYQKKEKVC